MKIMKVLFVAALFLTFLIGCTDKNTRFPKEFSVADFNQVKNGMNEKEVEHLLGKHVELYTHVIWQNGSGNNYRRKMTDQELSEARDWRRVKTYSYPANAKVDYEVYEVFFDQDWLVCGKQIYLTE